MATMNVKDAAGATVAIEKPLVPGRAAAASSRPVVLSTEDLAAINAILAKIIAAPATEAKQDTGNASLASIDTKMSDLRTYTDGLEALAILLNGYVDGLEGKDFATQTTLAAVLAKIIAAPATEAKQDIIIGHVDGIETLLGKSSTGTQSNVASSATDVTILAANANRKGATIFNDSTAILYLLLANAASSATVFTVAMNPGNYFEVPFGYTGIIKGIWASANGNARVTELT